MTKNGIVGKNIKKNSKYFIFSTINGRIIKESGSVFVKKSSLLLLKTNLFSVLFAVLFLAISSCSYNNLNSDESVKSLDNEVTHDSFASPVATIEAPSFFEGGVPKNTNLIISFTKAIDKETFWNCLIITDSMGKSLKENFNTPIWSNNDTLVEICPNAENFIDLKNKSIFDIYVTIPKTIEDTDGNQIINPIDFRYRINDSLDEEKPDLYVSRAELPGDYLSNESEAYLTVLIDGEITSENMEDICFTNHINSKFDIYLEGNDYGGGEVWASIKYQRVSDTNGKALEEAEQSKLVKLTNITYAENYYDTICLDLSDSKYLDGMYKVTAAIKDASCNESNNQHVLYVIRDTSFMYSPNAAISVELPEFDFSEENPLIPTKEKIKEYTDYIQFNNIADDVFFSQEINDEIIEYLQSKNEFTYYLSWGFSLTELSIPVRIYGEFKEEDNAQKQIDGIDEEIKAQKFLFALPDEFKLFRENNLDKDIILQAKVIDSVGNSCFINSVVPPQIDFFNYEVWDGLEENTRRIKLNFSDLTNSISKAGGIPDKLHSVSYRIYYGCLDNALDADTLELTRNFCDQISDVSDTKDFTNVSEGILSDSTEFEIEENSTYVVYIQPVYSAYSRTNGRWCGDTFGPLYELSVDTVSSGEDPEQYSFTLDKESNGTNSGSYTISVSIQNGQDDVSYYPCYSLDGKNWNTYKDLSFVVNNPLRAPIKSGELWSDVNLWQNNSFFTARDELLSSYSELTAKVRIMAVKGNKTVCSDIQELIFTREDDNLPPEASAKITSHDSMLSFDGRSFKYDGIIREDDLNTNEIFKYYYTEYNENWGSNLSVLTEDKINELPVFQSRLSANIWQSSSDSSLQYSISPVVYVNGLKDGKYMFFAKVWDSFGNENFITLGKANIGTFKNKLKVKYDKETNQFTSVLKLEENESRFDRNMINIQAYSTDKKVSSYANGWYDFYENQNELQNCEIDTRGKILSNVTKSNISIIDKMLGGKVAKSKPLQAGTFYRISVQSFNDNTYNPKTKRGVNKKSGRPYEDSIETGSVVPSLENESDYDLYTDETVSYPVYYYIPGAEEDMSKFKGSFFKNTAAISTNRPVIINLISSQNNLGSDIDEWERRGKLIKTYYFAGNNGGIPFKDNDVREDILNSDESGQFYYAMVVHFANNTSEISNVYKMTK